MVLHNFMSSMFKLLHGIVFIGSLKKIVVESKRINTIGVDVNDCKCILWKTHGLPCANKLAEYARVNMPMSLESTEGYWRKLDMSPLVFIDREVVVDLGNHLSEELEMINQRFFASNNLKRTMLLKRLRELVTLTTSSLIEPAVKIKNMVSVSQNLKLQLFFCPPSTSWWIPHKKVVRRSLNQIHEVAKGKGTHYDL